MFIYMSLVCTTIMFQSLYASKQIRLEKSYGHVNTDLEKIDVLNPNMNLTLTIVTGSLKNTHLVSIYYSKFESFYIVKKTSLHLKLQGTVRKLEEVFQTIFVQYKCPYETTQICFATNSEVSIPNDLKPRILGIIGLEQVLTLKTNFEIMPNVKSIISNFLPTQVALVYGFPNSDGANIRIGIISLGGFFNQSDLQNYFTQFGLGIAPTIRIALINGAKLDYIDKRGISIENYLDVEIIASIVPKANITFYYAPNSFQGFYDAINKALQQSDVVTCSWDTIESVSSSYWKSFQTMFLKYSNIPFFIATGDQGSAGGVGFPASCPNAISCGGTTLNYIGNSISSITSYQSEVSWSGSNGGYSKYFKRPSYQNGIQTNAFRGLPDLAANANPGSGFKICYIGKCMQVGGTSAVAPLYGALTARLMSSYSVRQIQNDFANGGYYKSLLFHDIFLGNNGGYNATIGWDAVTGMGSFYQYSPNKL